MPNYENLILQSKNRRIIADIYIKIYSFSSLATALQKHMQNKTALLPFKFEIKDLSEHPDPQPQKSEIIFAFNEKQQFIDILAEDDTYTAFTHALKQKKETKHSYVVRTVKKQKLDADSNLPSRDASTFKEEKAVPSSNVTKNPQLLYGKRKLLENIPQHPPAALKLANRPRMLSLGDYSLWKSGIFSMVPFIARRDCLGPQYKIPEPPSLSPSVIPAALRTK